MSPIRVLIAADQPVVRYGLSQWLSAGPEFQVAGEAIDPCDAIEKLRALSPDVTLLDMEMGETQDAETLRTIRNAAPTARIVGYTAFAELERAIDAINLGIEGYLLKKASSEDLAKAIRIVHAGETFIDARLVTKVMKYLRNGTDPFSAAPLTKREHEVLGLLAEGNSNRRIANSLSICERTVKFHVSSILYKLHAGNRTQAVAIATRHHLIDQVH